MKFIGVKHTEFEDRIRDFHSKQMKKLNDFIRDNFPEKLHEFWVKADFNLSVDLSKRCRIRAGSANLKTNTIALSYQLHVDNPGELLDTFGHELAHIITRLLYPFGRAHGREWKLIMRQLGLKPDRTHTMDVKMYRNTVKRYIYSCNCRSHELTSRRHSRIARGVTKVKCLLCDTTLVYSEKLIVKE